jgi:transposase
MKESKELYYEILGLQEPWEVDKIDLELDQDKITIHLTYKSHKGFCPECGKENEIYDKRVIRKWRHLDTCQLKTYIVASIPRINCKEHMIKSIQIPWAQPNSHFTFSFERFAIEFLQATFNQTKTSQILRISFSQINTIMKNAVKRGLSRREKEDLEYIGIDEKSMKKGHSYMTIIYNLKEGKVLDLTKDRKEKPVLELMRTIKSNNNCKSLKAISMDMWKAYMIASNKVFPLTDIVHDKFHIMKYMNDGVDKTRKREAKKLDNINDNSLKKTKYLFLKNQENMTENQFLRFEKVKNINLETCKAWEIKENFKGFFNSKTINEGKFFFNSWLNDVRKSGLKYMKNISELLIRHWDGIITYIKHRITNSLAENINGKIQKIKTIARGFKGFENYRISILFYLALSKFHD